MLRYHVSVNDLLKNIEMQGISYTSGRIESLLPLVNVQKGYIKKEDIDYFKTDDMLKIRQEKQLKSHNSESK